MKTKICTSLEQSKKLMELGIDINTADMCYCPIMNIDSGKNSGYLEVPECYSFSEVKNYLVPYLPTWSLTALLKLIPNYQIQTQDNGIGILYGCKDEIKIIEGETPIDAAFEMVCWLLENKKL